MIKPFDQGSIKDIEKAILASDLGLTPMNDGKVIRLHLPPLTEERRREFDPTRTHAWKKRASPCATSAGISTRICAISKKRR